jgi:hypothetical protein
MVRFHCVASSHKSIISIKLIMLYLFNVYKIHMKSTSFVKKKKCPSSASQPHDHACRSFFHAKCRKPKCLHVSHMQNVHVIREKLHARVFLQRACNPVCVVFFCIYDDHSSFAWQRAALVSTSLNDKASHRQINV